MIFGNSGVVLTMPEFLTGVTALGALGLLNVIRRTATTTTHRVRLIVAFTKAGRTFRLRTQINNRYIHDKRADDRQRRPVDETTVGP